MMRTHTCGELRAEDDNKDVTLCGWVDKVRTHGGVTFIDIRDRYGMTQVVVSKETKLHREDVVKISGKVAKKPEPNKSLATGEIEVKAQGVEVLNQADTIPLDLEDVRNVTEETRLKYRFLDLRREEMQNNIILRHRIVKSVRDFFDAENFLEIETPMLAKSTPEGARDYLVPSRVNRGKFFALPQSPQIFKQLCMVAGFDRYMQIVRCFRDEDLRADRQPEFTQIDVEMSFVGEEDIYSTMERLMVSVFKDALKLKIKTPFPRITYDEAMLRYGSDKPDMRFDLEIKDVTETAKRSDFKIFKEADIIRCLVADGEFSRKDIDKLTDVVKIYGAKGLAYYKHGEDKGIAKFIDSVKQDLANELDLKNGDNVFFVADKKGTVAESLGALRLHLADKLSLRRDEWKLVWVTDFPLLEWSEEDARYVAMHHPFTSPKDEDIDMLQTSPEKVHAKAYDLTLNGTELGGGSIRIHRSDLQKQMFKALGISDQEAERKFGFLMEAFRYGAPPHGGIAFGLDRLVSLLSKNTNIREVIAFPKTKNAEDLMMGSPGEVKEEQLDELGISLKR